MGVNTDKKAFQGVTIAGLRAQGLSCRDIAQQLDITYRQVARRLKDSDVQDILNDTLKYYSVHAEEIREEFLALCKHEDPGIRSKNISEYHKVMGMNTPHTPIFIQNIYQDNRKQIISPHVQDIISKYSMDSAQVIELIEDKSKLE